METACTSPLGRAVLVLAGLAVVLIGVLALVGKADASLYVVPDPPLKARATVEGKNALVTTRLTCPFPECAYTLKTAPGTAKADGKDAGRKDYNPFAYQTITLTKGQAKSVKFKVLALKDDVCERTEYFYVALEGEWSGINDRYGGPGPVEKKVKVNIKGNSNCLLTRPGGLDPSKPVQLPQTQPTPAPAPAPAPAPNTTNSDSTNGRQSSMTAGSTTIARCATDLAAGVAGQAGAWGNFVPGCTVKLTCPASVRVCRADEESRINLEFYRDERVTLNSRLRVFSASNTEFFHRDVSCDNSNWCSIEDTVMIRGGESASVECNGVRQTTANNRARNSCTLSLESTNS